jgi:hypothetical protein
MRVAAIMYPGPQAEAGVMPDEKLLTAMGKFNEELVKAGVILAGDGFHPTSKGARVRFASGKPEVSRGPFSEAREIVGGYWIWQVESMEAAIEWAKRCPASPADMIELRRVYEADDFGPALTPEVRAAEERMRKEVASRKWRPRGGD